MSYTYYQAIRRLDRISSYHHPNGTVTERFKPPKNEWRWTRGIHYMSVSEMYDPCDAMIMDAYPFMTKLRWYPDEDGEYLSYIEDDVYILSRACHAQMDVEWLMDSADRFRNHRAIAMSIDAALSHS